MSNDFTQYGHLERVLQDASGNRKVFLRVPRCPLCAKAEPYIFLVHSNKQTESETKKQEGIWGVFKCTSCNGLVSVKVVSRILPFIYFSLPLGAFAPEEIPEKARSLLDEARDTLAQPHASIMVASSSVGEMLQEKLGVKKGKKRNLYDLIEEASKERLLTDDMKKWAHDIRLQGNDSRHPKGLPPATKEDARRVFDFASMLGEFLFVLPARVKRGREEAKTTQKGKTAQKGKQVAK